ncbi:MAG: hypothetical protein NVSMB14_06090 [Isosphaeraceae bacterium]
MGYIWESGIRRLNSRQTLFTPNVTQPETLTHVVDHARLERID